MMTLANVLSNDGRNRLAICNICGKEGPSNNMPSHIEANHITGISHTCNICGKTSRSRNALKMHKHNYHKALLHDVVGTSKAWGSTSLYNTLVFECRHFRSRNGLRQHKKEHVRKEWKVNNLISALGPSQYKAIINKTKLAQIGPQFDQGPNGSRGMPTGSQGVKG